MGKFRDLSGLKFGRLTVVGQHYYKTGTSGRKRVFWHCLCECGARKPINADGLISGNIRSFGCLSKEVRKSINVTHGANKGGNSTATYRCWQAMKTRCTNPKAQSWQYYGGRGIGICARWLTSFDNFLQDMGEKPEGMSIDRIDNDKSYSKENCRWATTLEQANNVRSNHKITFRGQTKTLSQWSVCLGLKATKLRDRLKAGWSVEDALTKGQYSRRDGCIEFNGQKLSMAEWAKQIGLPYNCLRRRFYVGWSIEDALTTAKGSRSPGEE